MHLHVGEVVDERRFARASLGVSGQRHGGWRLGGLAIRKFVHAQLKQEFLIEMISYVPRLE